MIRAGLDFRLAALQARGDDDGGLRAGRVLGVTFR